MSHSLATIISYCTNDYRFISRCITEAKKFSRQIVIPVCDHFFDGTPENRLLLEHTYADHPDCQFIEFSYLPERLYSRYHTLSPTDLDWSIFWAATTRYVGIHYVKPEIEWVFFLDSDEIAEGEALLSWIDSGEPHLFDAQRLAAYLYSIYPTFRSKKVVNLPLLVKKQTLDSLTLLNGLERIGCYQVHPGPKRERALGLGHQPLIHHYSWVRTQQECLQKARTWGHRHDCDWPSRIEKAFSEDPRYLFETSTEIEKIDSAYFDPLSIEIPSTPSKQRSFSNVLRIDDRDLFLKGIEAL